MYFLLKQPAAMAGPVSFWRSHSLKASSYFDTVNIARGLCLIWMLLAHTLSISDELGESWLNLLHMPGWSTTNFVMLSGFALALFAVRRTADGRKARSLQRGVQLLIIAYVSNIFFASFREIVHGGLTLPKLVAILLAREPWTISAILLPSAVLVFLSPYLEILVEKIGSLRFLLAVSLGELAVWQVIRYFSQATVHTSWFASLFDFDNTLFVFPLGILLGLGIWAYSLGAQFRTLSRGPLLFLLGLTAGAYLLLADSATPLLYVFRFGATLVMAALIALLPGTPPLGKVAALLGRSSLLVFILHRALLQVQRLAFANVGGATRAPIMFLLTLAACIGVCLLREHYQKFGAQLKRVGF